MSFFINCKNAQRLSFNSSNTPGIVVQLLAVDAAADGGGRREGKHFPGEVLLAAEAELGPAAATRGRFGGMQNRNRKLLKRGGKVLD
jgi:hypothetical protein